MAVLKEYLDRFKEEPFIESGYNYDHPNYQELMLKAIERNSPITKKEVKNSFRKIKKTEFFK